MSLSHFVILKGGKCLGRVSKMKLGVLERQMKKKKKKISLTSQMLFPRQQ